MALSRPFKEDRLALLFQRLSPSGDRWCGVLGFVSAGSERLKLLNTSDLPRSKPKAVRLGRTGLNGGRPQSQKQNYSCVSAC